jgi:hypothetical protein
MGSMGRSLSLYYSREGEFYPCLDTVARNRAGVEPLPIKAAPREGLIVQGGHPPQAHRKEAVT